MLTFRPFAKRYALPYWRWYLGGMIALAITNLVALEVPQLAKTIVNQLAAGEVESDLANTALLIVGLGVTMMMIRALSRILIFWPARNLEADLKSDLFGRTLHLPLQFFERHGMGDLISRLANDVGHLRVFFAFGLLQIFNMIFLLTFTIEKMLSVHAGLTLASLAPLVLMVVITRITMPLMHKYSQLNQEATGRLTNRVTEAFVNVHVIKANAAEGAFETKTSREIDAVFDSNIRLVFVRTLLFPLMTCLSGLSILVVLFYGGKEVIAGRLTIGDILAFNVYIGLLTFPLTAMGIIMAVYQRMITALARVAEIDAAKTETTLQTEHRQDHKHAPLLEVRNLSFRFPEDDLNTTSSDRFSLQNISFTISAGKRVGIFGPIGSGKSTLMHLATRLYNPPPNTVFFRGQDVLGIPPQELRQSIGYALQSVHLFSDTIAANLSFGHQTNPAKLAQAARRAQIADEIESFDQGWETEIGEKGVRLSGGQKQRLALARLLLREPDLMLLDDVLSAVDHTTEKKLIQEIRNVGSSMLIASHRGSALQVCDEILVLEDGKITDRGSFEELSRRYPALAAVD